MKETADRLNKAWHELAELVPETPMYLIAEFQQVEIEIRDAIENECVYNIRRMDDES